jgi:hypothetical protein
MASASADGPVNEKGAMTTLQRWLCLWRTLLKYVLLNSRFELYISEMLYVLDAISNAQSFGFFHPTIL